MMNYEEFMNKVVAEVLNYFPEEYKSAEVIFRKINKVNEQMDGLTLKRGNVAPTVYIQDMYDAYQSGWTFEEVMRDIAEYYVEADKEYSESYAKGFERSFNDNIIYELIPVDGNEELLKNVPHREFLDLAIIYRWILSMDEDVTRKVTITNQISEDNNLPEEVLYGLAKKNTPELNPPIVFSTADCIKEIDTTSPFYVPMLVITNVRGSSGAAAILYDDVLEEAAEMLNGDIYLLPSSIHEFLAVNAEMQTVEDMKEMVTDINANKEVIADRDVLCNSVYLYKRGSKELEKVA